MSIIQEILNISTTLLAFGVGLFFYKHLQQFCRILFFLVGVCLLTTIISRTCTPSNNGWLYNIYIVIETATLLFAAQAYFNTKKSKQVLMLLLGVFLSVFFADVLYFRDMMKLSHRAIIVEGMILTGVFLWLLYNQLTQKTNRPSKAIVVASIGMVFYFAGIIPYLGAIFYIHHMDPALGKKLFYSIVIGLSLLRYLLVAIAFFMEGRKATRKNRNQER